VCCESPVSEIIDGEGSSSFSVWSEELISALIDETFQRFRCPVHVLHHFIIKCLQVLLRATSGCLAYLWISRRDVVRWSVEDVPNAYKPELYIFFGGCLFLCHLPATIERLCGKSSVAVYHPLELLCECY
jgi:hypothetical protein